MGRGARGTWERKGRGQGGCGREEWGGGAVIGERGKEWRAKKDATRAAASTGNIQTKHFLLFFSFLFFKGCEWGWGWDRDRGRGRGPNLEEEGEAATEV